MLVNYAALNRLLKLRNTTNFEDYFETVVRVTALISTAEKNMK